MNNFELYLPPLPVEPVAKNRREKGGFVKGCTSPNKGRKWEGRIPREAQARMLENLKKGRRAGEKRNPLIGTYTAKPMS